jgi:hypothetical protein
MSVQIFLGFQEEANFAVKIVTTGDMLINFQRGDNLEEVIQ